MDELLVAQLRFMTAAVELHMAWMRTWMPSDTSTRAQRAIQGVSIQGLSHVITADFRSR